MAYDGSFLSSGWHSTTHGDYVYLSFEWCITDTSIDNNKSTIYWQLVATRAKDNAGWVEAGGFKVVIDGDTVYNISTNTRTRLYKGTIITSGTKTFTHNADGTRSFSVQIQGGIYNYAVNVTGSKTFALETIPRASSISCTTANIESNPTITINRASSSFTHTITYKFGTLTGTVANKTSATTITNWKIPPEFYSQIPNAKTGEGTLTCTTYNGSTQIGSPTTCKLSVTTDEAKCKPTVSGTVVDKNAATIAVTGNKNILVRYRSTALCTINATLNKNAGKISLKTINNVSVTGSTLEIPNVDTNTFDFYAKDSREYHNSDKVSKPTSQFIQYIPLTNDATIYRDEPTSGKATLKIEGNYFKGNFGAVDNTLTVKYRKEGDTNYTPVTATISGNKYSATVSLTELDYTKTFNFEVVVTDKLTTISKPLTLPKGIPVFDWGENDFNFNVPVKINGTAMADFVVSQGISGSWIYRKWNSGAAECWGEQTVQSGGWTTVNTADGVSSGLHYTAGAKTIKFPPTLFTDVSAVNVNVKSAGGAVVSPTNSAFGTAGVDVMFLRVLGGTDDITLCLSVRAVGKWK